MVKGVLDSTVTNSDFYTIFDNVVATNPHLQKTITEVRNESNLFLVKVLRFYPHRDMAFVQELGSKEKYYCHTTHEMLSYEVSINCMCEGNVGTGDKYGTFVAPYSNIYGIVADVRFKGTTDEKCLLACLNYNNDNQLKSNVKNGEIRIVSGDSTLSLTGERINLMTPQLFINGLPYDEPSLKNYYEKWQVDTIKSNTDAQLEELNKRIDNLDIGGLGELIGQISDKVEILDSFNLDDYYTKTQADDTFSPKTHTHSNYLTSSSLTNYVQKSQTQGLLKNNGTVDTTVYVATTDSRLSDSRTPTSHSHGNVSNDGKIGSSSGKIITTDTGGVLVASDSITVDKISDFPSTMTPSAHNQASYTIIDDGYYNYIGNIGNTQESINDAINTKIGYIEGLAYNEQDVMEDLNVALEHINTDYVNYTGNSGLLGGK